MVRFHTIHKYLLLAQVRNITNYSGVWSGKRNEYRPKDLASGTANSSCRRWR